MIALIDSETNELQQPFAWPTPAPNFRWREIVAVVFPEALPVLGVGWQEITQVVFPEVLPVAGVDWYQVNAV